MFVIERMSLLLRTPIRYGGLESIFGFTRCYFGQSMFL